MDYNYTLKKDNIDYGFVKGNNKIVFVKAGLGGTYLGYGNKYLIMAHQLCDKYGCSVIVASNPHDGRSHSSNDKQIIQQYIADSHIAFPELFFFGHSNGGIKGLELANANVEFKK